MAINQATVFHVHYPQAGIAVISIDLPGEKVNTLRAEFAEQFTAILAMLKQQPDLQGVVIISGKPDSFIAGADITMLERCKTAQEAEQLAQQGQRLFTELETFPVPVVAAIHGACLGGGLELVLACHYRICSLDEKTVLALPEVQLGLLPGSGGTQRLPRLIGVLPALDMMLTGRSIRAQQAIKKGLVDEAVPHSILLVTAINWLLAKSKTTVQRRRLTRWQRLSHLALCLKILLPIVRRKILAKSRGNYPALPQILHVVKLGLREGMPAGLAAESHAFGELVMSKESAALRSLFFASTALKKELGSESKPSHIQRVGVLGGGLMGGGIAYVTACKAKLPVRIKDVTDDGAQNALHYSWQRLQNRVRRRQIRPEEQQQQMKRLSATTHDQGLAQRELVIEAVFEDLTLKQRMVADIESLNNGGTIFASNTSSLPIAQIAQYAKWPDKIIGLHYFSPVDKMPLVEIIPHDATSDETVATTVALAQRQGKIPIVVADRAGFYINRILAPYMNEAARCLLEGEPIERIDQILVDSGFPVGPIKLLDEVGIDVGTKIIPILVKELGERFAAPEAFATVLQDGRRGRKNGRGFYLYGKKSLRNWRQQADPTIYSLLGITPHAQLEPSLIARRCIMMMLNEAVRCLAEGVIRSPRDGDAGAVFGIGFPPFLGGPFRYLDQLGAVQVVQELQQLAGLYGDRFTPCATLLQMAEQKSCFYPANSS